MREVRQTEREKERERETTAVNVSGNRARRAARQGGRGFSGTRDVRLAEHGSRGGGGGSRRTQPPHSASASRTRLRGWTVVAEARAQFRWKERHKAAASFSRRKLRHSCTSVWSVRSSGVRARAAPRGTSRRVSAPPAAARRRVATRLH